MIAAAKFFYENGKEQIKNKIYNKVWERYYNENEKMYICPECKEHEVYIDDYKEGYKCEACGNTFYYPSDREIRKTFLLSDVYQEFILSSDIKNLVFRYIESSNLSSLTQGNCVTNLNFSYHFDNHFYRMVMKYKEEEIIKLTRKVEDEFLANHHTIKSKRLDIAKSKAIKEYAKGLQNTQDNFYNFCVYTFAELYTLPLIYKTLMLEKKLSEHDRETSLTKLNKELQELEDKLNSLQYKNEAEHKKMYKELSKRHSDLCNRCSGYFINWEASQAADKVYFTLEYFGKNKTMASDEPIKCAYLHRDIEEKKSSIKYLEAQNQAEEKELKEITNLLDKVIGDNFISFLLSHIENLSIYYQYTKKFSFKCKPLEEYDKLITLYNERSEKKVTA